MAEVTQLIKRKKDKNYLFMNTGTVAVPAWVRDTKSTDFAIAYNPQTQTYDFISDALPSTETESFQPSIDRTLSCYIGEPLYDYLIAKARNFAMGSDAETQIMLVYQETNGESGSGLANLADKFDVSLEWGTDDMVAGTLTYKVALKGTPTKGTATIDATGKPVFSPTVTP